uniref:Uncharacterized protein n=1 Tax=Amphimedon queenslandica TaxID=400682 RepID=A0A1X7VAW2_AMPQE
MAETSKAAPTTVHPNGATSTWSNSNIKLHQGFFDRANRASFPLHLKGRKRDVLFYKGMVFLSMVGLAISFGGLYKMANGTISKKGTT